MLGAVVRNGHIGAVREQVVLFSLEFCLQCHRNSTTELGTTVGGVALSKQPQRVTQGLNQSCA